MRSMIGLLIVAVIALLTYKYYFSKMDAAGTGASTPMQTIDTVGVKNDLLGIAQAEGTYQVEHNTYTSLDELVSSGALSMKKTSRDGYVYEVQPSDTTFLAIAHCPAATQPGCTSFAIDQTNEIRPMQ
ncbi:MAG: hypothetical protein WA211_13810 [Candidatus Acidiferrales bacterium]|jgi:hypothetical protein